jgi:hypothetical protein
MTNFERELEKELSEKYPNKTGLGTIPQRIFKEGAKWALDELSKGEHKPVDRFTALGHKRPDGRHVFYEDHIEALTAANAKLERLKQNIKKVYKGELLDEDIHLEIFGE